MRNILQSQLIKAIRSEDLTAIQACLDEGADPNFSLTDLPPLHEAVKDGYIAGMKALHDAGANINLVTHIGNEYPENTTPVMVAATHGQTEAGRWLLERGADASIRNTLDSSPLLETILDENLRFADLLLDTQPQLVADLEYCAERVINASGMPLLNSSKWLLERGIDPNATNDKGYTWLYLSVSPIIISDLIKCGADVNQLSPGKLTPLRESMPGNIEKFVILLRAGADPDLMAGDGHSVRTALKSTKRPMYRKFREALNTWEASCRAQKAIDKVSSHSTLRPL